MQSFEMNLLHLLASILFSLILGTNAFSYKEAKNWGKKYPECNGKNQSPIIFRQIGVPGFPEYKKPLRLTDFDKLPNKLTIKNTGHTVEMRADWPGKPPTCSAGPLHGDYVFEKATFHWAPKKWIDEVVNNTVLNETCWQDMEMHMFFYRTDLKSFEKAQTQKRGLVAFNKWFLSPNGDYNHMFDDLERNLHKVRSPNSTTEIPPFPFANLIEDQVGSFKFYEGSLDYPPCSETVTWFIDDTGCGITDGLLHELRKIKLVEGDVSNVRPPQALNKRKIQLVCDQNGPQNLKF